MTTIAIDARMFRSSGIGSYIRNLVPRVIHGLPDVHFTLLGPNREIAGWKGIRQKNVNWVECHAPIYSVSEQLALFRAIPRDCSLFWSPHYNIPLFYPGPLMVTVHDVFHLANPQWVEGWHRRWYAKMMFSQVAKRNRAILCVSEFTKSELIHRVPVDERKIKVIHNGVDSVWFKKTIAEPRKPYLLFVGNLKPHKNLSGLLDAFRILQNLIPHELLIAGNKDGFQTSDRDGLRKLEKSGNRVRYLGEVGESELHQLYAGASALVFPSFYEGFGLPPLEAMAAGCPVAISKVASLPEICLDAVLYFNPNDANDMAKCILRILKKPALRSVLRKKGLQLAKKYSWNRCAKKTIQVIKSIICGT